MLLSYDDTEIHLTIPVAPEEPRPDEAEPDPRPDVEPLDPNKPLEPVTPDETPETAPEHSAASSQS